MKRKQKQEAYYERTHEWQRQQSKRRTIRNFNQNLVDARKNRRVDWELGALAPRRDIGDKAASYGTLNIYDANLPELSEEEQMKFIPISEGDRVVVLKGRDRGKIGEVTDVLHDRNGVRVTGVNVTDTKIPDWMAREEENNSQLIYPMPRHLPVQHVRLVYPLPDPETGVPRDVVIQRLECIRKPGSFDPDTENQYERVIPGTNTVIPWPEKAEPEYETYEADTEAITLDERTFRPYLLAAPMPISVIDELRNKYSKLRTRHDPDYIEKKEAEAARLQKRKELGTTMRTPLQELAELRAKQKKREERDLTDEQLAKIGEMIEREEMKALGGVREMSSRQPEAQ